MQQFSMELEQRLINCNDLKALLLFKTFLDDRICIDSISSEDKLINEYAAIVNTLITNSLLCEADECQSTTDILQSIEIYNSISVTTDSLNLLLFFQLNYNHGVALCKLSREREGLMKLNDALNLIDTLPQPTLSIIKSLKLKTISAIILTQYSLTNYTTALHFVEEYLLLCASHEDTHYDMLCVKASILYHIGEYSKTITISSNAISMNPNRSIAYGLRAFAKLKLYLKKESTHDFLISQNFKVEDNFPNTARLRRSSPDLMNLLSSHLDSFESFLMPTSQLTGHIAFHKTEFSRGGMEENPNEANQVTSYGCVGVVSPVSSPSSNMYYDIVSPISRTPSSVQKQKLKSSTKCVIGDVLPVPNKTIKSENLMTLDDHNVIPRFHHTNSSNKPNRHSNPAATIGTRDSTILNMNCDFDKNRKVDTPRSFSVSKAQRHNPNLDL